MADTAPVTCRTHASSAPSELWDDVADLFVEVFSAAPYDEDPDELALISDWGPVQLAQPGGRLAAAHAGEDLVGFALVHGLPADPAWRSILSAVDGGPEVAAALDRPESALVVHELAVRSTARGRGIARTCLQAALQDHGASQVFLGVHESATRAVATYRRWGLVDVGAFRGPDSEVTLLVLTSPRRDLLDRLAPSRDARSR